MKTFRLIGMALLAVVVSVNFCACSDDEEENVSPYSEDILGLWECIEGSERLPVGTALKFFEGEFDESPYNEGGTLKGKKCMIGWGGRFEYAGGATDPTETQWDESARSYDYYEFPPLYTLSNNSLKIFECDYDRWIGTIAIEGDIMTYTYKYQDWIYLATDNQELVEETGPFVSIFQKKR